MKGFRKFIVMGVFLITLLVVIDNIDAGKKEPKKRELENKPLNTKENSKTMKLDKLKRKEYFKQERIKRSESTEFSEEPKKFSEESKKHKVKKAAKYLSAEETSGKINVKPKYVKSYQKVKKYKVLDENEAAHDITTKGKRPKVNNPSAGILDEKNSQKKTNDKIKFQEVLDEELDQVHEEHVDNEPTGLKRKKYKLVEVVLEEDPEEEREGNETYIEEEPEDVFGGNERIENEEVSEKLKTTYKVTKNKRTDKAPLPVDYSPNEETIAEEYNHEESAETGYKEDSHSTIEIQPQENDEQSNQLSCKPIPENPNRVGPKKLVLYVIEEEVDGQIKKRVVSEEDGVTMCEVADLMKEHYYTGLL